MTRWGAFAWRVAPGGCIALLAMLCLLCNAPDPSPDALSVCRYTRENHNSVLGIREYALQHSARFQAVEQDWVEDWISGHKESDKFVHPHDGTADEPTMSLFAFPAEENFSGGLYPLRWIREVQVQNFWHCFLFFRLTFC